MTLSRSCGYRQPVSCLVARARVTFLVHKAAATIYRVAQVTMPLIDRRFLVRRISQLVVSWIHQRYVWHTETVMAPSSHVVYYEDLKVPCREGNS